MPDAVIVSAVRTAIGRAEKGSLATVRPEDLVAAPIRETLRRAGIRPEYWMIMHSVLPIPRACRPATSPGALHFSLAY